MSWFTDMIRIILRPWPRPMPKPPVKPPVKPPQPVPTPTPTPEPEPEPEPSPKPEPTDVTWELLAAHNRERANLSLTPLALDPKLQLVAQEHANQMALVGVMAHDGIGDGKLADRLQASGYRANRAGENVAWNQRDVPAVMTAWLNSPGHRANIMGGYRDVGLALARGVKGDPYWCSVFGFPTNVLADASLKMVVLADASRSTAASASSETGFHAAIRSTASSISIALRHPSEE